jgi:hypothetical protein
VVGEVLMRARGNAAVVLVAIVVAGCAGAQESLPPADGASNAYVKLPAVADGLTISTTDVSTDGRFAKVRGRVTNPHSQAVEGIRYRVRIEARGERPRMLDRVHFDSSQRLEPGETAAMRLDVESMYLGTAHQLSIIALPTTLDGQPVPVPDGWQ